ncbi:MAG: hypothetical protein RJB04_2224, partial [Verrucomicrobiota bacterium]
MGCGLVRWMVLRDLSRIHERRVLSESLAESEKGVGSRAGSGLNRLWSA